MGESMIWDSPGGYLEFFPPCTCGHPINAHERNSRGQWRRCTVWHGQQSMTGAVMCKCKMYTQGDPADFPPITPKQPGLF